nr:DUF2243 domain-containing protein [Agrococcus sp. ARC_14]
MFGVGLVAFIDETVFHQLLHWHHFYDRGTPELGLVSAFDSLWSVFDVVIGAGSSRTSGERAKSMGCNAGRMSMLSPIASRAPRKPRWGSWTSVGKRGQLRSRASPATPRAGDFRIIACRRAAGAAHQSRWSMRQVRPNVPAPAGPERRGHVVMPGIDQLLAERVG